MTKKERKEIIQASWSGLFFGTTWHYTDFGHALLVYIACTLYYILQEVNKE